MIGAPFRKVPLGAVAVNQGIAAVVAVDDGVVQGDESIGENEILVGRAADSGRVSIERNRALAACVRVPEAGRIVCRSRSANRISSFA
jgi:hypothetical protein